MLSQLITRRLAIIYGASVVAGISSPGIAAGKKPGKEFTEVELVDEPTRGMYGEFDLANFGPKAQRRANRDFLFPEHADSNFAYGIDVSHHTKEVPWTELKAAKVNYVYVKASQSRNGRDGKFLTFWSEAKKSGLPIGAYHFLTAGVSGVDQGNYFLQRLAEVNGLQKGHLQPVIDLEWDTFGPDFKRIAMDTLPGHEKKYKDYWDGTKEKAQIVSIVNDCVRTIRAAAGNLDIRPVIYTNRSWWETHIPTGTVFAGCTVWISDYRERSYTNNSPRSVQGHAYHLWQFTDRGGVTVKQRTYGPFDCNKLVFGNLDRITIA